MVKQHAESGWLFEKAELIHDVPNKNHEESGKMNWKLYVAGAAICLSGGYILYRFVFMKKKTEGNLNKELIDTDQNQSIVQKSEEIPSDKTENIDNKAKEEFLESCRDFYGAYESLYQISTSDINNNLQLKFLLKWEKLIKINKLDALNAVWEKTIMNCSGNETKSLINFSPDDPKLKKIASKWIMKLEEWGVERKEEEEFIIEVKSTLYYDIDDIYEFGEKAQVIEKCWIISRDSQGNKLKEPITVEKGLARLLKS